MRLNLVNAQIDRILRLVDDEKLAKYDLQRQLDVLKKFSEDCVKDAEDVQKKFSAWQDYALEIRLACTEADGMTTLLLKGQCGHRLTWCN